MPLVEVLRSALSPWLDDMAEASDTTVSVEADETIMLPPHDVSAVAMLSYELATNATKYGPLGEAGGALDVVIERDGPDDAVIRWVETADHALSARKAEEEARDGIGSGFGSVLVQHCVNTLRGRVKREMTPTGLHFELHLPVFGTKAD